MATPVVITLDQYLNLITSEHSPQPRYMATVALSIQPVLDGENVAYQLVGLFDLDTAVGQQLDMLGQWVGLTRIVSIPLDIWFSFDTPGLGFDLGQWIVPYEGAFQQVTLDDAHYRLLLRARIAANQWDGTIPGAYEAWNKLFAGTGYVILIQDGMPRAEPYFSFDDPSGGFDRSMWYQPPLVEPIYFTFDDAALGFDEAQWVGPWGPLTIPVARTHGNMHLIEAILGPPLDAITLALFTGGYLGLKSAGVQIDFMMQGQPVGPPDEDPGNGIGLPLFAFDAGPPDLDWWMSYDDSGAGLDDAPLFYPGAHPIDPDFVPVDLTFDSPDPAAGFDAGYWTPAVRPSYFLFDAGTVVQSQLVDGAGNPIVDSSGNPIMVTTEVADLTHGFDVGSWYTPGASWWNGTSDPPPLDPDEPLPPTGIYFPPTPLAGFDLGAWGVKVS